MNTEDIIRYVSDGVDAAKRGEALDRYAAVAPLHDSGALPVRSHYAFGWIIYYAIHQSADADIDACKHMLARYLKLSVPRPHKLHSMILTQAIRLYKNAKEKAFVQRGRKGAAAERFSLVRFCDLWGLANLRPGDWRRKEHEGTRLSSTVEKLITHYVDELESARKSASPAFEEIMERALTEYPDTHTILSQRAALHMLAGRNDEAADLLRRALLVAPGKFFLWQRMAEAIAPRNDVRLQTALLYKALSAPGEERFKGRIHMVLAQIWMSLKAYGYALWELQRMKRIYDAGEWHLPPAAERMLAGMPDEAVATDPAGIYRSVEPLADAEIYSALPSVRASKCYHREMESDGRFGPKGRRSIAWGVRDAEGHLYWFQPRRFRIDPMLPDGTEVDLRVCNGKPVAVTLAAK